MSAQNFFSQAIKNRSCSSFSRFNINFISNIASYKEGLVYLKELLNRDPKLSTDKLEKLLDKLNEMIKTKYDSRITNSGYSTKSLVISALHDISAPSNISQDNIGACAGTTIQIQLALKSPIEYLKMIDLLAKNESYKDIKTNWTFTKEGLSENSSTNRSISSKIMQNAIMDYSNGAEIYDSTNLDSEGLGSDETLKGLNNLFDNNLITYAYEDYSNYILGMLKLANPSKENPIQIDMNYEKKGRDSLHAVNVIGIDNNNVTIINPWGREETFSTKELENKVMKINAQKGLDFLIPKLTTKGLVDVDSLFNRKISSPFTDGVSNAINESKGKAEFLKDLNLTDGYRGIFNYSAIRSVDNSRGPNFIIRFIKGYKPYTELEPRYIICIINIENITLSDKNLFFA